MASIPLNDVQLVNFTILTVTHDAAREDPAAACCKFGLNRRQLQTIGDLTPHAVMAIVARMGNELLFAPREDLDVLLTAPASLLPVLASARAAVPTRRVEATATV